MPAQLSAGIWSETERVDHGEKSDRPDERKSDAEKAGAGVGNKPMGKKYAQKFEGDIQEEDPTPRSVVVMKPPTGGPNMGAASRGHVIQSIDRKRSCFAVARSTTSRPTGTIMAPPSP
jgi:hypothetical protein